MGFFDKAKNFMGGHGVKVSHLVIERQDPAQASLPIGDTVVKGRFKVTAEKPCQVLAMKAAFCMEVKHADGRVETVVLGQDVYPEPNTSRSSEMVQYPFELVGGAEVEDYFNIIMDTDIPAELSRRSLRPDQVRFFVKTTVDVKGSPFDPEAQNDIRIVQ